LKKNALRVILLLPIAGYIFSTILTNGPLGITRIYLFLYSIPYLAFIEGAVRYMPNLLIMVIFLFLISSKELIQKEAVKIRTYKLLIIPILAWFIFLITHANLIYLVNKNVMNFSPLNDEIGALYKYDGKINVKLNKEKLVYNVLPIPSFFSPYFIDNIYPKTSQGSETDSYFSKGLIITNGTPSATTSFLNAFIHSKLINRNFYSLTNVKYFLLKTTKIFNNEQRNVAFTYGLINIGKKPDYQILYKIPSQFFLPKLFSTYNYHVVKKKVSALPYLIESDTPLGKNIFFFKNQNSSETLSYLDSIPLNKDRYNVPIIEFKKINSIKYRIAIHEARGVFPLIFSENFHDGWKSYLTKATSIINSPQISHNALLNKYKILDGNTEDQASKEGLKSFIDKGWITTLGSGKEKKIKHMTWKDNREKLDYVEKYNIDFISKKFSGTIQNDNLPNGSVFETWFKKPIENNKNHLMVNGYANSWVLNTESLCSSPNYCKKNSDGSYDFEIVIEFEPQQLFYVGYTISGFALFGCLVYLVTSWLKQRSI